MSLVGVFGRDRNVIFYIDDELLFNDFKWFSGYFTMYDAREKFIDIFLSHFISYYFFIILIDIFWFVIWTVV